MHDAMHDLPDRVAELERTMTTMQPTLNRLDNEFFNHNGDKGLKTLFLEDMAAREAIRKDRETREARSDKQRSNRVAIAAILAVLVSPPAAWCTAQTVHFFHELYQITLEWEQVHHADVPKKSFFDRAAPQYSSNHQQPQDAGIPAHYEGSHQ